MKLTLIAKKPLTSDITSFIFEPESPLAVLAGQYFHYVLPHPDADDRGTERWFTNSAAPSEGVVMISTRLAVDRGSSFKRALNALQVGETIEADGPEGDFVVKDYTREYIFVVGGIGITPFRSILTEAHNQGTQLKVTLLFANRNDEIPFRDELDSIAAENPNMMINYLISPMSVNAPLIKKYADAANDPLVYIAGPEPMVKSLADELGELGFDKDRVKLDDFPGYEEI